MHKIKVVHIVENLNIGGLENVVAAISRGLRPELFDVSVWCLTGGGDVAAALADAGIPVVVLGMRNRRSVPFLLSLGRRLASEKIDIVHTHGPSANFLGRLAAIIFKIPVIFAHLHSTYIWYSLKQRLADKVLSCWTDRVVCCSWAVAEFAIHSEGIDPEKVVVIYNGVDTEKFVPREPGPAGRTLKTIGCIAALAEHKGHTFLLQAARRVIDAYGAGVRFVFVGKGTLEAALRRQAESLGITAFISFTPATLQTPDIIGEFDIAVLPSCHVEGLGLSLIESMSAGKPLVGTSIGGVPEIIRHGENGLLVAPSNAAALAEAILVLLRDEPKALEMGRAGRRIALEKFSSSAMVARIERLYLEFYNAKSRERKN